ncbi:hypothetical protein [Parasitella parasitica]|uniref:Reverse transcriptase domain-containing protein n=1 Tax=Parasitella parasitica TaxID=35722 RepID=A0A0B7MP39_9FUNG|nr:hypothetical protein [Parasitella parasitica]
MAGIRTLRSRKKIVSTVGEEGDLVIDSDVQAEASTAINDTPMAPSIRVANVNHGLEDNISWESDETEASSTDAATDSELTSETVEEDQTSIIDHPYSLQKMKASAPLKVPVSIHGKVIYAIIDSGASVSVMNEGLASRLGLKPNGDKMHLVAFDDYQLSPAHIVTDVPVMIGGHLRPEHICVQKGHVKETDYLILGTTFCKQYNITMNMAKSVISLPVSLNGELGAFGESVEVQGFSHRILGLASTVNQDKASRTVSWVDELEAPSEILAVSLFPTPTGINAVNSAIGAQVIDTYFEDVVEDDDYADEGLAGETYPKESNDYKSRALDGDVNLGMPGPNFESTVPNFQVNLSSTIQEAIKKINNQTTEAPDIQENSCQMKPVVDFDRTPTFMRPILQEYADCFVEISGLGRVKGFQHDIKIKPEAQPVRSRPYKLTWEENAALEKQLKEMLEMDLIEPGTGEWSSPCFFLRKRSGELRLVIDYRKLNAVTLRDVEIPLPSLEELVDLLAGKAKYVTTLDMAQGYYQVPHTDNAKVYSQFVTPTKGCFAMKVLAFGEAGGPFTFGTIMQKIFKDFIGDFLFVFYDDAIIFSSTEENHVRHVRQVLEKCREFNLRLKWKKCQFATTQGVEYLGHTITPDGLLPLDRNTIKIQEFPKLKDEDDLRSFLGLTNYYHKFIPNYAIIAEPLHRLLKKKEQFIWGTQQQEAFETLKRALITPPLLAYPRREYIQVLTTDASYLGIAGILSQVDPNDHNHEEVISYQSRGLRNSEKNYSQVHLEALAVVFFVQKYAHYLAGRKFILRVDNQAIAFLLNPEKAGRFSSKLSRWSACLSGFEFETVSLLRSKENPADPLSRIF